MYVSKGKGILQPHNILDTLDEVQVSGGSAFAEGPFLDVLHSSKEAIVLPPFVAIAVRLRPGIWEYVRVNVEQLGVSEYLRFKEELVDGQHNNPYVLELDFEPFTALIPTDCLEPLLDFLREHRHKGHVMILNDRIQSVGRLQSVLTKAEENLSKLPAETPYSQFANQFQEWGLEKGWGDTAEHVLQMIHSLLDILQAPDPSTLKTFLGRIPMIFNVVIVSHHGYFGKANALDGSLRRYQTCVRGLWCVSSQG